MTQDEILAMEAGRGIDALIATHILGLAWWRRGQSGQWIALCPHDTEIPDYWIRDVPPIDIGEDDLSEAVPCYSTDIAAAWQVADKLHNSGWWVRVKSAMNEDLEQLGWAAHIGRWWNREYLGTWALTAPLVICRAALLAIMEAES